MIESYPVCYCIGNARELGKDQEVGIIRGAARQSWLSDWEARHGMGSEKHGLSRTGSVRACIAKAERIFDFTGSCAENGIEHGSTDCIEDGSSGV